MGDEDRMREAADKGFPGHFRLDDRQSLPYCAEDGEDWPCPPVAALGSLLRAVADQRGETGPLTRCPDCDGARGAHEEWCVWGSALALADAILVGQDAQEALR